MLEIEWVDAGQSKRAKAQKWWRERDCKVSQIQVPVELLKLLPLEFCQILSEKSWFCNNNLIWRDAPNDGETEVERDSPEVSWLFALLEKRQSLCIVGSDCLSVFLFFFFFFVFFLYFCVLFAFFWCRSHGSLSVFLLRHLLAFPKRLPCSTKQKNPREGHRGFAHSQMQQMFALHLVLFF